MIASQPENRWDDDEIKYFKNIDGEAVVYHRVNFDEGSGIWWYNNFFYKYEGDKLIPVLNELENGNLQDYSGRRAFWLDTKILKKDPLTIKMVYYVFLNRHIDSIDKDTSVSFINDSTIVRYKWDGRTKTLQGQFNESKISRLQVLSYALDSGDNVFIAAYYNLLRQGLNNKTQRPWVLAYLNKVKNNYR